MAFAYDKLNELVNQKVNIFDPTQGQSGQTQGQDIGIQRNVGDQLVSGTGPNQATTQAQSQPSQKAIPTYKSAALINKNVGEIKAPTQMFSQISGQLTAGEKAAKDEANAYYQQYVGKAASENPYQTNIGNALKGDTSASGQIASYLSNQPQQVEQFTPTVDVENKDLTGLGTEYGVGQYLRKGQDEQYTAGETALDRYLMTKNPQFQNIMSSLKGQQQQVTDIAKGLKDTTQTAAQERYAQEIESEKAKVKADIKKKMQGISDIEAEALAKETIARKGLAGESAKLRTSLTAPVKMVGKAAVTQESAAKKLGYDKNLTQAKNDLAKMGYTPNEIAAAIGTTNANKWFKADLGQGLKAEDFVTPEQAKQYNALMMMLGEGGKTKVAGKGAGKRTSFNQSGFMNEIVNKIEKDRTAKAMKDITPAEQPGEPAPKYVPNMPLPGQAPIGENLPVETFIPVNEDPSFLPELSPEEQDRLNRYYPASY